MIQLAVHTDPSMARWSTCGSARAECGKPGGASGKSRAAPAATARVAGVTVHGRRGVSVPDGPGSGRRPGGPEVVVTECIGDNRGGNKPPWTPGPRAVNVL